MQQKHNLGTKRGVEENACLESPRRQPTQSVVEEPKSSSRPRAHHSITKICSSFQRRASLLHDFKVHRNKSPNSSQYLFFSP